MPSQGQLCFELLRLSDSPLAAFASIAPPPIRTFQHSPPATGAFGQTLTLEKRHFPVQRVDAGDAGSNADVLNADGDEDEDQQIGQQGSKHEGAEGSFWRPTFSSETDGKVSDESIEKQ